MWVNLKGLAFPKASQKPQDEHRTGTEAAVPRDRRVLTEPRNRVFCPGRHVGARPAPGTAGSDRDSPRPSAGPRVGWRRMRTGERRLLPAGDARVWVGVFYSYVPKSSNAVSSTEVNRALATYTGLQWDLQSFCFSFSDASTIYLTVTVSLLEQTCF